ncbi:MAG: TM2 domain-containing protein [Flavobacteriales bacterium]|nr:TM2 domain-containing protein [Flavobacteriales bacterium]
MKVALAVALLLFFGGQARAGGPWKEGDLDLDSLLTAPINASEARPQENKRGVAIALAVLLGPFGAHRLYMGTTPVVAAAYGLTFGGFGVLVLIDLVSLITTKDLERYEDCPKVIMWAGDGRPTPP